MTDTQLGALTPRLYHLLLDRHRDREYDRQWQVGVLAATIANNGFMKRDEPVKPSDFALSLLQSRKAAVRKPRINRRKIAEQIRAEFERAKLRLNKVHPCPKS